MPKLHVLEQLPLNAWKLIFQSRLPLRMLHDRISKENNICGCQTFKKRSCLISKPLHSDPKMVFKAATPQTPWLGPPAPPCPHWRGSPLKLYLFGSHTFGSLILVPVFQYQDLGTRINLMLGVWSCG